MKNWNALEWTLFVVAGGLISWGLFMILGVLLRGQAMSEKTGEIFAIIGSGLVNALLAIINNRNRNGNGKPPTT